MSDNKTPEQELNDFLGITGEKETPKLTTPNLFSLNMGFKTPPVYGAELKASELAAGQRLPEDTATARAAKTLGRIQLGTPAEQQRDAA